MGSTDHLRKRRPGRTGRRVAGALCICVLAASACTSTTHPGPSAPSQAPPSGGTLRVGVLMHSSDGSATSCEFTFCGGQHDDPQWAGEDPMTYEVERCCLQRTLLSYNGEPTNRGGTLLRPDLATELPTISSDGLTWTFHLRSGLHYAPPLQRTLITAPDFIRSIERLLGPPPSNAPDYYGLVLDPYVGGYLALADLIAGARDYIEGRAEHISGLEAPDPSTLRIHLTRADGGIASILSEPDTAPIAPNPFAPGARFGVLDGHPRLAFPYMVGTGPYMIEGAEKVDYSVPPDRQVPPAGDAPDTLTLVRNPSWSSRSDGLRAALPDRIVLSRVADPKDALAAVDSGALDLVFNWDAPPNVLAPGGLPHGVRAYGTTRDWVVLITVNTASPPLDDVHVRRAMNYAVSRDDVAAIYRRAGQGATAATHIGLDSEEDNLLLNFDPYHAVTGDVAAAKQEMSRSSYDRNADGTCDVPACDGIRLLVRDDQPGDAAAARKVAADLAAIGLNVRVLVQDRDTFNSTYGQPRAHIPLRLESWLKDLTSGSTYFPPLFGSPAVGLTRGFGESLLGASPAQLHLWGYPVASVPNVDARIEACLPLAFGAQTQCWARLDQYLMSDVVPWLPLLSLTADQIVSSRVTAFAFDQSASTPVPALDRVALHPGVAPPPSPLPSFAVPAIPDGVYRFTISKADLYRLDPKTDPQSIDESTGTFTIRLDHGKFAWVQNASHPVYGPAATGIYQGAGDRVTFETQAPADSALMLPSERWTFDGHELRFTLVSCRDLDHLDPSAPRLCEDTRTFFESEPWVKVG